MGNKASVEYHASYTQRLRCVQCLPEPPHGYVPGQRIDGAGDQLGEGAVEPQTADTVYFLPRPGQGGGLIQQRRIGEGDGLQSQLPLSGQRRGAAVHAGDMQFSLQQG